MGGFNIRYQTIDTTDSMIEIIKNIIRKIGLITLTIALFSVLSYLITYCFLYGYYFGGEIDNYFSNFEFFRRFVPFHSNTMTFTYLMISLSGTLIFYVGKIMVEKSAIFKSIACISLVVFHVIMTGFFTSEINLKNIVIFGAIWILPFYLILFILLMLQGARAPFKTISGILYGFLFMMILIPLFNYFGISRDWTLIVYYNIVFIPGILLTKIRYNKYLNFIFVFPFILLIVGIIIFALMELSEYNKLQPALKITLIIGVAFLLSIFISKFLTGKFKEKANFDIFNGNTANNTIFSKIISVILNPKEAHKDSLTIIVLFLLALYVMTPRISASTGKIIRSFTPVSEVQFDQISIKDLEGKKRDIKGIIVAEQDSVIYVSNEKWELVQVKTDNYYVEKQLK